MTVGVSAAGALALAATVLTVPPGHCSATRAASQGPVTAVASATRPHSASVAPPQPPARICSQRSVLSGPAVPPKGAVLVPAGRDGELTGTLAAGATYWFAPGLHTLSAQPFAQVRPAAQDRFVGAPGAVLSGRHTNLYAFGGNASGVSISYLEIENFGAPGQNANQGVVNHDSAPRWTISHDVIADDAGAGVMLGTADVLERSCVRDNGQYGVNVYAARGVSHIVLTHNEIWGNDTDNWERRVPGCGCSGGIKFWRTIGAVVTDNYIHGNHDVGLWVDTDNSGFDIAGNYISHNYSNGIIYEASYNARIVANTLVANGIGRGPTNPGFPTAAIYISESGSDPRVSGPYGRQFLVEHNTLVNNWAGIVLWENANRFCNSPANTSTGACTLVDPSHVDASSCIPGRIDHRPYYWECRWRTQNVDVEQNTFVFLPATTPGLGRRDPVALQGLLSNWGTFPSWSPYKGPVIERSITRHQHNVWANNVYVGPWRFMVRDQANVVGFHQWRTVWHQDRGSVRRSASPSVPAA